LSVIVSTPAASDNLGKSDSCSFGRIDIQPKPVHFKGGFDVAGFLFGLDGY
jgi:hypothetical protein